MSRKRSAPNEFQMLFSFDADDSVAVIVETPIDEPLVPLRVDDVASAQSLPTDAPTPSIPETLSPKTFVSVLRTDRPAPTVQAGNASIGDARQNVFVYAPHKADASKPVYRIPLMSEINALPWNGLNVVSTFSGCGGSCLGFKMVGYRVLWANEFVPAAQATYRANHAGTHLDTSDIRAVTPEAIRAVIGDVEIDVLEGSPPCASFSTAGKTVNGWGKVRKYSDVEQRTDDLFKQYIRILDGLRPRAFVAENVAGIAKGISKGFFKRYLKLFRKRPYNVEAYLLDAQHLGVPQARLRLIFVGVRQDVGHPRWPRKLPYRYSVRDAIPWIGQAANVSCGGASPAGQRGPVDADGPSLAVLAGGDGDKCQFFVETTIVGGAGAVGSAKGAELSLDAPAPSVLAGGEGPHGRRDRFDQFVVETRKVGSADVVADNVGPSLDGYAIGAEYDKLKPGETSDKFFNLVRPDADAPCPTVTQTGGNVGAASVAHPTERRKFTIAELRRICGFPDDFVLTGTYGQQWERLGRSVPPPMMRAVAEALLPVLLRGRENGGNGEPS